MLGCPLLGSHHAHLRKLITAGHVLPEAGRYLVAIEWRHVERTDQDDGVEHGLSGFRVPLTIEVRHGHRCGSEEFHRDLIHWRIKTLVCRVSPLLVALPPCGFCYSSPNICSSLPERRGFITPLAGRPKKEGQGPKNSSKTECVRPDEPLPVSFSRLGGARVVVGGTHISGPPPGA
jgi:hypothetical protein